MLGVFSFRKGDNSGEDMRGVIGWLFTLGYFFVIPTVLLELTVSWLYEVSGGSDSVWDFGQILTFVTVVVATGAPIGSYLKAVSPADPSVRGYHIFWNDGSSHRIHKSNLSMCQCERSGASCGPSRWTYRGNNSRLVKTQLPDADKSENIFLERTEPIAVTDSSVLLVQPPEAHLAA
jgi:hypothetical protein